MGSGNITIKKTLGDLTVEIIDVIGTQVTTESPVVTIDIMAFLEPSTSYYVLIDSTAFENPYLTEPYPGISSATALSFTTVVNGCTDPTALNYDVTADIDDGNCVFKGNAPESTQLAAVAFTAVFAKNVNNKITQSPKVDAELANKVNNKITQSPKILKVTKALETSKGNFLQEIALSGIFGLAAGKLFNNLSKKNGVNSKSIAKRSVAGTVLYELLLDESYSVLI